MEHLISRITINPHINFGKPSVRNIRFSVSQMLELLASGMAHQEIFSDYPYVEIKDVQGCLECMNMTNTRSIVAIMAS